VLDQSNPVVHSYHVPVSGSEVSCFFQSHTSHIGLMTLTGQGLTCAPEFARATGAERLCWLDINV